MSGSAIQESAKAVILTDCGRRACLRPYRWYAIAGDGEVFGTISEQNPALWLWKFQSAAQSDETTQ